MADSELPSLTLRAIEIFLCAAEEESISLTAKRLGTSNSTISLQLSKLEQSLGVRLVERNARHFQLTEAGKMFRHRALKINDEVEEARNELSAQSPIHHATLRIAVIEDFDPHILPMWISKLETDQRQLKFVIKSGPSHENFESLTNRAVDLIVANNTMDAADWIEEYPILDDPFIAVASREIGANIDRGELLKLPFIRYSREQLMGRQIEAQLRRSRFVPPGKFEVSSNQAAFAITAKFSGWTITTALALSSNLKMQPDLMDSLHIVPLPVAAISRTISLYARRNSLSQFSEEIAEHLRTCIREFTSDSPTDYPTPLVFNS